MEDSEEDTGEDEAEWSNTLTDSTAHGVAVVAPGPILCQPSGATWAHRVILHFDLDCFYAQVEMIRNPALRHVPLGIQQKYIIVTCNYVAREQGLTKLMSVTDAKDKCPELVLVNGEDLTHYREMSYKVTELLMSYCPLVERLGFDENFMDVTEMVEKRLTEMQDPNKVSFAGHVYNHIRADVKATHHPRLVVGSHMAAELREAIHSKLGLTGCAGIATNKLLAKLVSGTFKPNQQTSLLPENLSDILGGLNGLRKLPGVGHQTAKKLQALGLVSVQDLQSVPLNHLVREFGAAGAQRLKNLAMGIDDSPVSPSGAPQSLSDEDSFKKISSKKEVLEKIQQLLYSLVERMNKDGRQPQTFRLTIRKYSVTNKWFSRESRQCLIPNHVGHKISSGSREDAVAQLVPLAMKLFHKMVETNGAFHLTLINVCFNNLQTRGVAVSGKGAITSFFSHGTSPRKIPSQKDSCSEYDTVTQDASLTTLSAKSLPASQAALHASEWTQSSVVGMKDPQRQAGCSGTRWDRDAAVTHRLHSGFDPEVFKLLPADIQEELLTPAYVDSYPTTSSSAPDVPLIPENSPAQTLTENTEVVNRLGPWSGVNTVNPPVTGQVREEGGPSSTPHPSDSKVPGDVDPHVFSQLPPDVQRELMSEWTQQKVALKVMSSRKPGRSSVTKERKAAGKGGQANSLLKYFKPS